MISHRMKHLIRCLARYEAFLQVKDRPELCEKLWGKGAIEDAEIVSVDRVKRRKNESTVAHPRISGFSRDI